MNLCALWINEDIVVVSLVPQMNRTGRSGGRLGESLAARFKIETEIRLNA